MEKSLRSHSRAGSHPKARGQAAAARPTRIGSLHPLAMVTLLCLCFPLHYWLGSLFLTPSRILFVFTVPVLAVRWAKGEFGGRLAVDWMIMFYVFWMTVTVAIHHPAQAVTFVGTTALIILGGYLTARATIRSAEDMLALARFLGGLVMVMMPFALYESVTENMVIPPLLSELPGFTSYRDVNYCCRLGLDRAQVVFVHPIHYGLFASLPFALYVFGLGNHLSVFRRVVGGTLIGLATFLSVSSGPFLSMLFQAALVFYAWATARNPRQWRIMLIGTGILYLLIELNTTHFGLFTIASKLSFNPATAYVRSLLFDYGIDQVQRTPIFGWGYNRIPMPGFMTGSVDNFWLLLAVTHGLPAFIACFGAFIYSMIKAGGGRFVKGSDLYNLRVSWTFLLVALLLALATVAVWSEVHSAVLFMLGAGQFMMYAREPAAQEAPEEPSSGRRRAYTRFPGPAAGSETGPAYARNWRRTP